MCKDLIPAFQPKAVRPFIGHAFPLQEFAGPGCVYCLVKKLHGFKRSSINPCQFRRSQKVFMFEIIGAVVGPDAKPGHHLVKFQTPFGLLFIFCL